MTTGSLILLISLTAAVAFGLYRALTDGRFVGTHRVRGVESGAAAPANAQPVSVLAGLGLSASLGERATLLQFSSAFCAPCRATRRVLGDIAEAVPGVEHLEIDAEDHLDLVRTLGIQRTPTTLILDPQGREVMRASGLPRKEQVLEALGVAL